MADQPQKEGYWERALKEPILEWFPWGITVAIIAVFAVIIVVGPLGVPHSTDIYQAGFRGTGMATVYKSEEYEKALEQIDLIPPSDPPYEYAEGEEVVLAGDVYENVQVLGHVSEDNFLRLMTAITEWVAPEQGCAYCHGEEGNFASDEYYPKVVSRRMIQMTQNINANWQSHVAPAGVNCYTCHRGMNVPQYIWFEEVPEEESAGGWRDNQNQVGVRIPGTSLPSNVYEKYLLGEDQIRVISQNSNMDTWEGRYVQDTEWSFALMIHMSKSLNVNCAYCHNTRSMSQWEQGPPARTTSWYGIRMTRELNNEYLAPLQPVYPHFRLGPTGDAPKANCATCHQGAYKPLFGEPAVANWPELAGPGDAATAEEQAALAE
jgi:photosynthetic reaction center cytochrome c subunit